MNEQADGKQLPPPNLRQQVAGWYLRDRSRTLWTLALWPALALLMVFLIMHESFGDPGVNLQQSRAALMALAPPEVPPQENAATDYSAAALALVKWADGQSVELTVGWDSTKLDDPKVKAYLQANNPAIQQVSKGAAKQHCNFAVNRTAGLSMPMPHLSQQRSLTKLLCLYARDCAYRGDHAAATQALEAVYAAARHLESNADTLISILVCIACEALADEALQAIVVCDPPQTPADVAAYRQLLARPRDVRARAIRALTGEKAFMLYTFDQMVAQAMRTEQGASGGVPWYGSDRRCTEQVMNELIAAAHAGTLGAIDDQELKSLMKKHQRGPAILTQMVLPVLARSDQSLRRTEDSRLCADTALAALQFRLTNKRDVATLDDLVPQYLTTVPLASSSGERLKLVLDPSGWRPAPAPTRTLAAQTGPVLRFYTNGQDQKDDQGLSPMEAPGKGDTVFFLPLRAKATKP